MVDVYRITETKRSITGQFFVAGEKQCFYLEPSRTTPVHVGHPCIPAGTYRVIRTMSPHMGYKTPEVLNVPGRTAIRWHIGNKPEDVLGCCVVGTELGNQQGFIADWVGNSKVAFEALMVVLNKAWDAGEEVWATYHDPLVA